MYRPVGGLTPLLYAARAGCLDCVKTMIAAGADKDRPNPDGMTPMIMALDNGFPEVARSCSSRAPIRTCGTGGGGRRSTWR